MANDGKVAEPDEETLAVLRGKHPEGTDPPPSEKELPPPLVLSCHLKR